MPYERHVCPTCHDLFSVEVWHGKKKGKKGPYCSRECFVKAHGDIVECFFCHKPFRFAHWRKKMIKHVGPFCSRACHYAWRRSQKDLRFWQAVDRCSHEQWCLYCCWTWKGPRDQDGYGIFNYTQQGNEGEKTRTIHKRYRTYRAHRYAWELLQQREMTRDHLACHWCHNRSCANPLHIYPGTFQQNSQHSARDRRFPLGTKNKAHKINEEICKEIRLLYEQGWKQRDIAARYSVTQGTVFSVIHRLTWKNIE